MEANLSLAAASAIQQSQVHNEIATAVARTSLQSQRQQGEAAVALLEQAQVLTQQLTEGRIDVQL